ncbi:Ig-like domain-containing protein [Clostridium sp. 'deep sea']|uniref:leucine-rich repeat protein n=1 Tax=Clostridium sp. 'deep sea' TaxID=2779445 RepID=UPI0018968150|nr:leucine-rich repeat protein [Clostridium sp. 'deep sea']QOR36866.1 Ig-like domain-containing protein [Clostridium sp. 'deep sea']
MKINKTKCYKRILALATVVILLAQLFNVVLAEPNAPLEVYVSTAGDDNNDGSAGNPVATITKAIELVAEGGTVYVKAGTYQENLSINKSVTLEGTDQNTTIIDGGNINRVISITDGNVDILKFTITKGKAEDGVLNSPFGEHGGGIFITGNGVVNISDCSITENCAGNGVISVFYNKSNKGGNGGNGGAIYYSGSSTINVNNCIIKNNKAGNGSNGGDEISTITFVEFNAGNGGTGGSGGAVYIENGTMSISNCLFMKNKVGNGGAGGKGKIKPNGTAGAVGLENNIYNNNANLVKNNIYIYKESGMIEECYTTDSEVEIPATLGSSTVTSIGELAFKNNTALTKVTLPKSIIHIGKDAFTGCTNLTSVYFKGNPPTSYGDNIFPSNIKIYYPEGNTMWTNPWNNYQTLSYKMPLTVTYKVAENGSFSGKLIENEIVYYGLMSANIPTLTPNTGYVFKEWHDKLGNKVNPQQQKVFEDTTYTAIFEPIAHNEPVVSGISLTNDTTPTWSWLSGSNVGSGQYRYKLNNNDYVITTSTSFTPAEALSNGSYTLYVQESNLEAVWSNSGSFEITIDQVVPQVVSFENTSNTALVEVADNLLINFNEKVVTDSGSINIKLKSDDSLIETIDVNNLTGAGTTTIEINPNNLVEATEYYVQIDSTAIKDLAENYFAGITDKETWSFKTALGLNSQVNSVTDYNGLDGSITATASGGTAPYQYKLEGIADFTDNNQFFNLAAGNYQVQAQDSLGNLSNIHLVTVTQPPLEVYVSTSGKDSNNGKQDNPLKTITKAIEIAASNGTVYIEQGIYKENLTISKNITLKGAAESSTILDGNKQDRVINIGAGNKVNIDSVTITNGKTSVRQSGGGILNRGELRLTSCSIIGNRTGDGTPGQTGVMFKNGTSGTSAGSGGAIINYNKLTIIDCTIIDNVAGNGGTGGQGGFSEGSRTPNLGGSGGNGGFGGGIYNVGTLNIENSTIAGNRAGNGGAGGLGGFHFKDGGRGGNGGQGSHGGAIYNQAGAITIRNSTITGSAGKGGIGGFGGNRTYDNIGPNGANGGNGAGDAIFNGCSTAIDAKNNWWGTTNQQYISSKIHGNVDTSNCLTSKPSTTQPLEILTEHLFAGIINHNYSVALQASGGTGQYNWQANNLPNGLNISSTGNITGTATTKGSYNVDVTLTDGENTLTKSFKIIIDEPCGNGGYIVIPESNYTNTNDIPIITVGQSTGLQYFTANIYAVTGHSGTEVAIFVHMRDGVQIGLSATQADFETINIAKAAFNVLPGDVIKVYIVDSLNNGSSSNPNLL